MKGIGNRSSEIFVYALVCNLRFSSFLGFSFRSSDSWLLFSSQEARMRQLIRNRSWHLLWVMVVGLTTVKGQGEEIGFVETYALAKDRPAVLAQLIPETEDYFYYHVLFYQTAGKIADAQAQLDAWVAKFGWTERANAMRARQMMLTYSTNRAQTIDYLRSQLGVNLDATPPQRDRAAELSTVLDNARVDYQSNLKAAIESDRSLGNIDGNALLHAIPWTENIDTLRSWLQRIQRVDVPNLSELVSTELKEKRSAGFGWAAIHSLMTLKQLERLAELNPEIKQNDRYVQAVLQRLRPSEDESLNDREVMRAHLDILEKFAMGLPQSQRNLQASVLHRRLVFDRQEGVYDRERFKKYLDYPRNLGYYSRNYLGNLDSRRLIDTNVDYRPFASELPPIGDDFSLVREYLEHFFRTDGTVQEFAKWIEGGYLDRVFAETKILYGIGDSKDYFVKLSPGEQKELKERVELKFSPTNPNYFQPERPVQLELQLKNVPELVVKIYRLNARNVLSRSGGGVSIDLDLDGLVANVQKSFSYAIASDRRHTEKIDLPEMTDRGLWIVDFLGAGQRTRALIQKGQLRALQRFTDAGQVLRIVDESGKLVPNAHAELGDRTFKADSEGDIVLPYGEQARVEKVLLVSGDFASYEMLVHQAEQYKLEAGFIVEPQALLSGAKTQIAMRPQLVCNGKPVSLDLLEETRLKIEAVDQDGIATTQMVEDVKLNDGVEFVHTLMVPQRLATLRCSLSAKVQNRSRGVKQDVVAADSLTTVNQVNTTKQLGDFYLQRHAGGYTLYALGRNGEPFTRLPVRLSFKVRGVNQPVQVELATNSVGACELGVLGDVENFSAECDFLEAHAFILRDAWQDWPARLHLLAGEKRELALRGAMTKERFSLMEYRGGQNYADHSERVEIKEGSISVSALTGGDYTLSDHLTGQTIAIAVTDGKSAEGVLQGRHRFLEPNSDHPVLIRKAEVSDGELKVKLENHDASTRVHLLATAFDNSKAAARWLLVSKPQPYTMARPDIPSLYVESLRLDEEYQYVMNRQAAEKFPGNLLSQPSVLLNPWDLSSTENLRREARGGDMPPPMEAAAAPAPMMADSLTAEGERQGLQSSSYEFLAQGALVAFNTEPDADGNVQLKLEGIGERTILQLIVVHPTSVVVQDIVLPKVVTEGSPWKLSDQRLAEAFSPDRHRAERQSIVRLMAGQSVDLGDARSTRVKTYSELSELHSFFGVLLGGNQAEWAKFQVLAQWDKLSDERKRQVYDELACHEVHLFLFHKDRKFFDEVVRPYLVNKLDKQLIDLWLLGEDVSAYTAPWRFQRLNALEKILLAASMNAKRDAVSRYLTEWVEAHPVDPEQRASRFSVGLISNTLDASKDGYMGLFGSEPRFSGGTGGMGGMGGGMGAMGGMMGGGGFGGRGGDESKQLPRKDAERDAADKNVELGKSVDRIEMDEKTIDELADASGEGKPGSPNAAKAKKQEGYFRRSRKLNEEEDLGRFFQSVEATKKWAESNYYRRENLNSDKDIIPESAFWRDYLTSLEKEQAFLSTNIDLPTATVHEALVAMAVTGLPFESKGVELSVAEGRLMAKATNDSLVFVQGVEVLGENAHQASVLVGQDVYLGNPGTPEDENRPVDRKSLLKGTHYQARVVVTNPTNTPRRLNVLTQIPQGSIALAGGKTTKNWPMELQPYTSGQIVYDFYFPSAGEFNYYGAQISDEKGFIAESASGKLEVLSEPKDIDKTTWAYIADWGTDQDVLDYLSKANLQKLDLNRIAFRMKDRNFFSRSLELLSNGGVFESQLWAYALLHQDDQRLTEWLEQQEGFVSSLKPHLESDLIHIDAVDRQWFEHLDFRPLVVARVHQLGSRREILNSELAAQYRGLLENLSAQSTIEPTQKLQVVYYLLLQNRIAEALKLFAEVSTEQLPTRLQYDYFDAYLAFFRRDYQRASDIAGKYQTYPEVRWQRLFREVAAQVKQRQDLMAGVVVEGSAGGDSQQSAANESQKTLSNQRELQQSEIAKKLPALNLQWQDGNLTLSYRNQEEVQVNYYLMDIELLFSRNPFVQQDTQRLSLIEPNHRDSLKLSGRNDPVVIKLPEQMKNANVLVEVIGGGLVRNMTVYANSLDVLPIEAMGRVQVLEKAGKLPLEGAYVKVYARHQGGVVKFFKDGYTDLRGEFDFASLSTNDLDTTEKFSLLVLHPQHGALILELNPPKR